MCPQLVMLCCPIKYIPKANNKGIWLDIKSHMIVIDKEYCFLKIENKKNGKNIHSGNCQERVELAIEFVMLFVSVKWLVNIYSRTMNPHKKEIKG